ncbi:hypothetical protein L8C07_06070 [Paenibacillus sp. CMAA1739]|uniref:hypothetical protein n=1 Tax=Paenibacillus ottowii TaxID=2315729 RepID=UPI002DBE5608|nr:hypothetical protein [Paenibacillus sp. CMAA1739]MEC4565506.1 hypothetical protein [Paenibacillus sp. CMAA1739]
MKNNNNEFFANVGLFISALFVVALALFLQPVIYVGFGYLGGLVVKWVFGGIISNGLNSVFGTDRFNSDYIPMIAVTLAFIGSYFRVSSANSNKK